ncbi:DNA-binding domain-containing protein [Ferrovibrio sp.]|uniref:HvfC/BufC N-terminal domain-containing protein n=1 Tax=Ferrovibrio sp. TaxID=1917215 RepID=UPI003D137151
MTPDLEQLQHWLLLRLLRPDITLLPGDAEIVAAPPAGDAGQRLAIYIEAYRLRLLECLKADHPGLARLLGDALFTQLTEAYIRAAPPKEHSLYALGAGFPAFLRRTQRGQQRDRALALALDLARFERQWNEVLRAQGLEDTPAHILSAHPELLLHLPATTRPLLLRQPLALLQGWITGEDATPAASNASLHYALIARRNWGVVAQSIEDWAFHALRAAQARPRSLHDCAVIAARRLGREPAAILAKLLLWAPLAQQAQLLILHSPAQQIEAHQAVGHRRQAILQPQRMLDQLHQRHRGEGTREGQRQVRQHGDGFP